MDIVTGKPVPWLDVVDNVILTIWLEPGLETTKEVAVAGRVVVTGAWRLVGVVPRGVRAEN